VPGGTGVAEAPGTHGNNRHRRASGTARQRRSASLTGVCIGSDGKARTEIAKGCRVPCHGELPNT